MNKSEETEFKEVMIGLGEYYNKEITEALTKIYWYDLKPLNISQFKEAASYFRVNPDTGKFFPKTCDILALFVGTTKQNEQLLEDKAQIQWLEILSETKRIGSWGALNIEDKQSMAAVKALGGWRFICSQTKAQLTWLSKDFVAAYKNFERTPIEALPDKLAGRFEIENHKQTKQPSFELSRLMNGIDKYRLENKE